MHSQLGLPVDGSVVTGFVQSADWGAICGELLGMAPETIYGGWIEMAWIRKNFTELFEDSIKVQRERYVLAYILQIIEGILMPDESRNLVHLRWLLKLVDFRAVGELSWGHVGLPTELQDIRLLLDQRLEEEDPIIREVIPEEFLVNPNVWHVKVPLVVYAIVEMHETDRVLLQFEFRQSIPVAP
ncbi:hypothetical protein Goshw_016028 [Gossypium schwendimanii]|uniref:Aminotransferase-like plant mobile domain-containing protein n=1 Tax=Gossypium schwendimanii TaxID=34291 RepID=A0A7J9LFV7_GOSSC|nr:hypothetical protein [Gossypium schwendimanii]